MNTTNKPTEEVSNEKGIRDHNGNQPWGYEPTADTMRGDNIICKYKDEPTNRKDPRVWRIGKRNGRSHQRH